MNLGSEKIDPSQKHWTNTGTTQRCFWEVKISAHVFSEIIEMHVSLLLEIIIETRFQHLMGMKATEFLWLTYF